MSRLSATVLALSAGLTGLTFITRTAGDGVLVAQSTHGATAAASTPATTPAATSPVLASSVKGDLVINYLGAIHGNATPCG